MKILIALLIFGLIIFIHELGHFLLAKLSGIVVNEFSLGMGPRLFSFIRGETRYSLKLFPIGGSCAMKGEDLEDCSPGSFNAAPVGKRICVVAAGPVFNFLLAFLLSIAVVAMIGYDPAKVASVTPEGNAYDAGLREGDVITRFNGYSIDLARDLFVSLYLHEITESEPITLEVDRDGEKLEFTFEPDVSVRYLLGFNRSDTNSMVVESLIPGYPLEEAGLKSGDRITAVGGVEIKDGAAYEEYLKEHPLDGSEIDIVYVRDGLEYETTIKPKESRTPSGGFAYNAAYEKVGGTAVMKYALMEMRFMVRSTLAALKELFTGHVPVSSLSGPVGVTTLIADTYEESRQEGLVSVLVNMMGIAILISVNLGIMNLLPFPALDGGRLVFLVIEAIRRKPVDRNLEGAIHFAGIVLLMLLMVFVMYNDILRLI